MRWRWSNPLTTEERASIEKILSVGMASFIWRRGILGFALLVGGASTALEYFLDGSISLHTIPTRIVIWVTVGCLVGISDWHKFNTVLKRG